MMENMTFSGVAQAWLALACRKAVPWLLERPQHAPRSPAGTPTCIVVCLAAPLRTPQPRARKRPTGRLRKACERPKKNTLVNICTWYVYTWYTPRTRN